MKILANHELTPTERALLSDPPLIEETDVNWRRRLNLYTGRALSDTALKVEQEGRAGRLATRGQLVSAGVLAGLEPDIVEERFLDPATSTMQTRYAYHIAAGRGLAESGEDVFVAQALRIPVLELPVHARATLLAGGEAPLPVPADPAIPGPLSARQTGATLGELIGKGIALPPVGILVLQPILFDEVGEFDPTDPCPIDPQADAFADWKRVDGARLLFYAWPDEWLPLPADSPAWRNQIAYTIFTAENQLGPDQLLPWEEVGVPIGLVAFETDWNARPRFLDRFAVVRSGGKAKRRTVLTGLKGSPFLWEARLQQFAEQTVELDWSDVAAAVTAFQTLPPAGLLPRNIADPRAQSQTFFPSTIALDAVPVPLEQLDLAMAGSASLAPIQMNQPDQVRLLVPVPQAYYEPRLLLVETVDSLFQQAVDAFVALRTELLLRRDNVRGKVQRLQSALFAQPYLFPAPDPDQQSDEGPLDPSQGVRADLLPVVSGLHQHSFTQAPQGMTVIAGDTLAVHVYIDPQNLPAEIMLQWTDNQAFDQSAYWGADLIGAGAAGADNRHYMGPLPQTGTWTRLEVPASLVGMEDRTVTGIAFSLYDGRAAWRRASRLPAGQTTEAAEAVWFEADPPGDSAVGVSGWNAVNFPLAIEDDFGTQSADGPRQVTDLETLRAKYAAQDVFKAEFAQLDALGLDAFITLLQRKVSAADDSINFGFLRVHTDIYRHRQLMLGDAAATRLAISPSLAIIAKGETATGSEQQLNSFYSSLQAVKVVTRGGQLFRDASVANVQNLADAVVAPADAAAVVSPNALSNSRINVVGNNLFAPQIVTRARTASAASNVFAAAATPAASTVSEVRANALNLNTGLASATLSENSGIALRDLSGIKLQIPANELTGLKSVGIQGSKSDLFKAREETAVSLIQQINGSTTTSSDVEGQSAIVGRPVERTTTIAERLESAHAPESKDYTTATKFEVVKSLTKLDMHLDDIQIPGLVPSGDIQYDISGQPVRSRTETLATIKGQGLLTSLLADPSPNRQDEAAYFVSGVELMDHTISILRQMEGRVEMYRQAISDCKQAMTGITAQRNAALIRLGDLENQISEARHNVAMTRALLAEEQTRINGINTQRDQVMRDYVTFLAYYRPRIADTLVSTPVHALYPDIADEVVPDCLANPVTLPAELSTLVNLMREMPLRWFVKLPPLLDWLDTLPILRETLDYARTRAVSQYSSGQMMQTLAVSPGAQAESLQRVFVSHQQTSMQYRMQIAQTDVSVLANQTWTQTREKARLLLSPGDLWGGYRARGVVARQVTQELDRIGQVAGCLYSRFGQVEPRLRLEWAERLNQYDAGSVNLRNLANLPDWNSVGMSGAQSQERAVLERRAMQALVDWLFGRVDTSEPGAVAFMNDVVRVCLLLASHAPVNRLLNGNVSRPVVVQTDNRIHLSVDVSRVRVGMPIRVMTGTQLVAHAVVEDLGDNEVSARILTAYQPGVTLDSRARAQFAVSGAFEELPNRSTSSALPPVYTARRIGQ